MRSATSTARIALAFAALLAALTFVIWRQGRAREALEATSRIRTERAVLEAERAALVRRIRELESRARVVRAARRRLGMHLPSAAEIVILPVAGGTAQAGRP